MDNHTTTRHRVPYVAGDEGRIRSVQPGSGLPLWIHRDDHTGRWMREGIPAGQRISGVTAAELAAMGLDTVWEYSGRARSGRALFHRTRIVAAEDGSLGCYDSAGALVLVHPADRVVRVLCRLEG